MGVFQANQNRSCVGYRPLGPRKSPNGLSHPTGGIMGIKDWLVRHTSGPSRYAVVYVDGLIELSTLLAAAVVAFSGCIEHPTKLDGEGGRREFVFEDHFAMEQAGFSSLTKDLATLLDPAVPQILSHELYSSAYRVAVAFVMLCSENVALRNMQTVYATAFCRTLRTTVARRCAGTHGFPIEPQQTFLEIKALLPGLVCSKLLNPSSYGEHDGLGNLLRSVVQSQRDEAWRGFVVGSPKQPLGCAQPYGEVLGVVENNITRCIHDHNWGP